MSGCQIHESQEGEVHSERKMIRRLIWKFLSIPQKPPSSLLWDMWIFVIKGQLFPMVPMIPCSERLFGMVGDGVLFKANRENTSNSARGKSQKTLFAYGLSLTDQQKTAIQARLAEIEDPVNSLGNQARS